MNKQRADPKVSSRINLNSQTETIDSAKMLVRSIITTSNPDRSGDVVVASGLRNAAEFLKNPVVLWAHQRTMPPIGICQSLDVQPDRILAETKFSESSPLAADVFRLYAEGVLRGWSIGFLPVKTVPMRNGLRIEEWDLLEYSAVPVPENPGALTVAIQKGFVENADLRRWLLRQNDLLANLVA